MLVGIILIFVLNDSILLTYAHKALLFHISFQKMQYHLIGTLSSVVISKGGILTSKARFVPKSNEMRNSKKTLVLTIQSLHNTETYGT